MGRLAGKAAVVTGGARGIGAGVVRRYVEEGARCVIADLDEDAGRALAAELGDAVVFLRTDVTSEADLQAAIDLSIATFGGLDVMVNNAGVVGVTGPLSDTSLTDYLRTMDILLTSVFLGTKLASAVMKAQRSGSIISTTSTAGVQAGLGPHVYTVAKHGVVGLARSAAVELAPYGVRSNAVAPGATVSSLTAGVTTGDRDNLEEAARLMGAKYPTGRAPMPLDLAQAFLFLASDESTFVNGTVMVVDSGKEVLATSGRDRFYPTQG